MLQNGTTWKCDYNHFLLTTTYLQLIPLALTFLFLQGEKSTARKIAVGSIILGSIGIVLGVILLIVGIVRYASLTN